MALLCARATAHPAPPESGLARGVSARGDAVAVAAHFERGAGTRGRVQQGKMYVAVCASEAAGVSIDTCRNAVIRVSAVRQCTA